MIRINDHFLQIPPSYLFSDISRKVAEFQAANPEADIIRMGIGDVTRPLCPVVIKALHQAADLQANGATFHGYGPEQGYESLRQAIALTDYIGRGIQISPDEIFIGDGAKSDLGNICDILAQDATVAVTDPVYPVYVDTNAMGGRAGVHDSQGHWSRITYLPCTAENNFVPALPDGNPPEIIYLCYPNNPTGTTLNRQQLKTWVDYALANGSLILFDSAYEAFITQADIPHSIYEIDGADRCAIEFRSFSKTAGFTGMRLGYTVVPKQLIGVDSSGREVALHKLWLRRQTTKFNGASFVVQHGALALFSPEGQNQIRQTVNYYMTNAETLRNGLTAAGLSVYGGINAPYIWTRTPDGLSSWDFFNILLEKCNIVVTPGSGFGPAGEGYVRLTAFSSDEATREAVNRIKTLL